MFDNKKKIVLAISGASGSIYALRLIKKLESGVIFNQISSAGIVFSKNAIDIWNYEIGSLNTKQFKFKIYENNSFYAPFASGSSGFDTMIICPCSMGLLGRIANGISNDLITRTADVILKERKKLILVIRETPLNLIHIKNMKTITEAGGIISPANPSFYQKPETINELIDTVIDRILELANFSISTKRWMDGVR